MRSAAFAVFSRVLGLSAGVLIAAPAVHAADPLWTAAEFNDAKTIKTRLAAGDNPNIVNAAGATLLHYAITEDSADAALALVRSTRVDVDKTNLAGETPLMLAALRGQLAVVKALVEERGVEINRPGWTPLHYAASRGRTDVVVYLLEHSAYIDAESPNGTTPLMMAALDGNIVCVKALLDAGADPTIVNALHKSAIDFAVHGNHTEIADGLRSRLRKLGLLADLEKRTAVKAPLSPDPTKADKKSWD